MRAKFWTRKKWNRRLRRTRTSSSLSVSVAPTCGRCECHPPLRKEPDDTPLMQRACHAGRFAGKVGSETTFEESRVRDDFRDALVGLAKVVLRKSSLTLLSS